LQADESLANSFNLEALNLEAIMFQSGYLTITSLIDSGMGVG
jgi:hypothetical protein